MGKLIYTSITSLDGYVEDTDGSFSWSVPDEELLRFISDLERPIGTYLYGRRMYETMVYWETAQLLADQSDVLADFTTIWQSADKIVYSRTLDAVSSAKTRIEPDFDAEEIRQLKVASDRDLSIGGSELAAHAIESRLVDELSLFVFPVVLGGGKSWLPSGERFDLELLDTHRFSGGVVYLRYRATW
jgi:dihydrofolate reductase